MDSLTETQLTAAGFPDALRPYLLNGTLVFSHARPDGTLEFMVPNEDEPKSAFTLVWHPEAPGTWAYDGLRFHVKEEKYSDIHHHDPLGDELVDFGSREGLLDWLDELPGCEPRSAGVPPAVPPASRRPAPVPADRRLNFADAVLDLLTQSTTHSGADFIAAVTSFAEEHHLIEPNPDRIVDGAIDEDIPEFRRTTTT